MNPMQIQWAQTNVVCSNYDNLFFLENKQKMMTVQFVQCHVADDYTGRMAIQMTWQGIVISYVEASGGDMWQGDWAYGRVTWMCTGHQSGSDTCHPCNGDMWHVYMDDLEGLVVD
jgi:hypothetical protein